MGNLSKSIQCCLVPFNKPKSNHAVKMGINYKELVKLFKVVIHSLT